MSRFLTRNWQLLPAGLGGAARVRGRRRHVGGTIVLGCAAFVAGCVTPQPVAESVSILEVDDVQRALADGPAADRATLSLDELASAVIRWGGTIAAIDNLEKGGTELEIVARPLARSGRPLHDDRSAGRFIAAIDGFLDPEIIERGRDITITGSVDGLRSGKVGDADYSFPVVRVDDYRYWKPLPATPTGGYGYPPGFGPGYPGYFYGPCSGYGAYYSRPFGTFNERFWHDVYCDPIHSGRRDADRTRRGLAVDASPMLNR